jgi:hypothetical protein
MKKVAQNKCHFSNFPKRSQSKPSPKRRKFAQSGHPDSHICPGTCFYSVAILHRPLLSITFEQSTIDLRNVMLIFDDDYGDANLITVNFKNVYRYLIREPKLWSTCQKTLHLKSNEASYGLCPGGVSSNRTEDRGFESRQGARFLVLCTYILLT